MKEASHTGQMLCDSTCMNVHRPIYRNGKQSFLLPRNRTGNGDWMQTGSVKFWGGDGSTVKLDDGDA